ncbi:lysine-rich coiled-coil protein 1 [Mantella aurantiaca]
MASEGAIIPQLVESITQSNSSPPSTATCSVTMAGGDISSSAQTTIPCQTEIFLDEKTKRELFTDTFCRVCGAVLQFESHRNAHYEGKRHAQKVRLYFLNKELEEMAYKKKVDHKTERINFHVDQQLAQDKNKFCSLCNMVFSSPVVAQSHYVGKIHTKKLRQLLGEPSERTTEVTDSSVTAVDEAAVPPANEQDTVMSPLSEKSNQQEASTEPSSADNEIDLSDPNKYCKLCCASFNNPMVAQQHYNGKKHARNELRRKLMEEMEDTGLSVDSGGDGVYVCPICSITLTSIEMYQSHMQGNKHQIKENIVAHLMKTTKKTYDSFENELEDYIKVQKARGLEPKTQFRPEKDQQDSAEETEPAPPHPNPPAAYKYFGHKAMPYPSYNPLHTSDHRMAGWEKAYWPQKPTRMPMKTAPPRKPPPSSPDSSDSSSSDDSSGSHKKDKRHRREHRSKERKHHSKSKRENESSERKKRKMEESDSGKEDSEKEKKAEASGDKAKPKKEKKEKPPADKESKKHKKPKKVEDQRTEEEILWDESILGF